VKTLTKLVIATGSLAAIGTLTTISAPVSYADVAAGTIEGSVVDESEKNRREREDPDRVRRGPQGGHHRR
jgi:hypothetical protein